MFRPGLLRFFRLALPDMTWRMNDGESVYLTFDDGPTPGITEWIIGELARHEIKATFFCLGKNCEQYPDLHELIISAGHKIGNHTYSHLKGWEVSTEQYVEDVDFANQILKSDIFRPPYGRISRSQAQVLSERYRLVMGDIVSQDYSPVITPRKCLHNVTDYVRPGSVIVFHDSEKSLRNMRYALPRSIEYIKKAGMQFRTIEFDSEYGLLPYEERIRLRQ